MTTQSLVNVSDAELAPMSPQEVAAMVGDLSLLDEQGRADLVVAICRSVGLNPLTRPLEYLMLDKRLVLYARKDATDQLRKLHNVSTMIVSEAERDGLYIMRARATMPDGRYDESIAAVPLMREGGSWESTNSGKRFFKGNGQFTRMVGEELANAIMKCETKGKRRVTLSICGLGFLDETEIETIPGAQVLTSAHTPPARRTDSPTSELASVPAPRQLQAAQPAPRTLCVTRAHRALYDTLAGQLRARSEHVIELSDWGQLASVQAAIEDMIDHLHGTAAGTAPADAQTLAKVEAGRVYFSRAGRDVAVPDLSPLSDTGAAWLVALLRDARAALEMPVPLPPAPIEEEEDPL